MSDTLTAKQEAFCLAIMEGKSQHDAYKQSFSTKNYSREALDVNGSKMMAKAKIKQRIEALRSPAVKKAQRSYGDWLQQRTDHGRHCRAWSRCHAKRPVEHSGQDLAGCARQVVPARHVIGASAIGSMALDAPRPSRRASRCVWWAWGVDTSNLPRLQHCSVSASRTMFCAALPRAVAPSATIANTQRTPAVILIPAFPKKDVR